MEIKQFKNLFCLCAVKGCKHIGHVKVKYRETCSSNFSTIILCEQCSYDLLHNNSIV